MKKVWTDMNEFEVWTDSISFFLFKQGEFKEIFLTKEKAIIATYNH